jgi:hypothetical protein
MPAVLGRAEFVMCPAEIVGATDQVHSSLQPLKVVGSMPTFARGGCEPLPHRRIETLNKRGIEQLPSLGSL